MKAEIQRESEEASFASKSQPAQSSELLQMVTVGETGGHVGLPSPGGSQDGVRSAAAQEAEDEVMAVDVGEKV